MLRTLKMRTLVFSRAAGNSYTDSAGNFIEASDPPTTFNARGGLQPLSPQEKETIPTKEGVYNTTAFYFYTKTKDIRPIDKGVAEADTTLIEGVEFLVWANTPWEGIKQTSHNVITLVKIDEVALDA